MVERKIIPVEGNCSVALAIEQMRDGKWAVVATITETTADAQRNTDLPVTHQRFDTQAEAEAHGLRMAREWIERNTTTLA
jgi:hypothetical protein